MKLNLTKQNNRRWLTVSWLLWLLLCSAAKTKKEEKGMDEILTEKKEQTLWKAPSVNKRNIWLLTLSILLPSHWLLQEFQCRRGINQRWLIFTIRDRGGSDSIGSSKLILWTPPTWGIFGQIIICNQVPHGQIYSSSSMRPTSPIQDTSEEHFKYTWRVCFPLVAQ